MKMKTCDRCGKYKSIFEFRLRESRRTPIATYLTLHKICKTCIAEGKARGRKKIAELSSARAKARFLERQRIESMKQDTGLPRGVDDVGDKV